MQICLKAQLLWQHYELYLSKHTFSWQWGNTTIGKHSVLERVNSSTLCGEIKLKETVWTVRWRFSMINNQTALVAPVFKTSKTINKSKVTNWIKRTKQGSIKQQKGKKKRHVISCEDTLKTWWLKEFFSKQQCVDGFPRYCYKEPPSPIPRFEWVNLSRNPRNLPAPPFTTSSPSLDDLLVVWTSSLYVRTWNFPALVMYLMPLKGLYFSPYMSSRFTFSPVRGHKPG